MLGMAAKGMLETFLRKWRKKREMDENTYADTNGGVRTVDQVCPLTCGDFCGGSLST